MRKVWAALCLLTTMATVGLCQTEPPESTDVLAGHSYHGEAFNEGPRQKPYLMKGLGRSKFNISTNNADAQSYFNQGVDQLHGFWYFEAERSFRQVAILDPDCAIAYWGLAMANINNEDRAKKFIKQAEEKSSAEGRKVTSRERMYIQSLAAFYSKTQDKKRRAEELTKNLEAIVLKFPDDIEAKAFLACQVWMNKREGIQIASHVGLNTLLDDIFAIDPSHPAHHYRIHLWDYEKPEIALKSAAMCGPSLPDIAHMWHMPGHIYSRLKRYEDAVWQQEASARVDHRNMMHDWVLPDQIHNFAHNNEWCIRNLIHVGRVGDAVELANNMLSLPRHPKYNKLDSRGSSYYGRQRLFQVFSTFEMWDSLIDACHSSLMESDGTKNEDLKRLRFLGRAYFRSGELSKGEHVTRQLEQELCVIENDRSAAIDDVTLENTEQTDQYRRCLAGCIGWIPAPLRIPFKKRYDRNVNREHRVRLKKEVKKVAKPFDDQINIAKRAIDEMVGHRLVAEQEYAEAIEKFNSAGQVDAVYRAYVRHLSGETEEALEEARKYVKTRTNEVQPLANLAWLLWECGEQEEAVLTLCELFLTSNSVDANATFFDRLDPIRKYAQIDTEWPTGNPNSTDLGERPALDSLGPFRWRPVSAPAWTLLDSNEEPASLSQYAGKPVVVIFYLGHGCLHCAEQLQAFAPKIEDFLDQGIEMIAISTDQRDGLKKSIDSYGKEPLPIRLLANPELTIFKKYHAFDEFESQALHGTFLIDGAGKIRWQDISYEPFMDPDFLLRESIRLLEGPIAR